MTSEKSMAATLSLFPATPTPSRAPSPAHSTHSSPPSVHSRYSICSTATAHTTITTQLTALPSHPNWPLESWNPEEPAPTHTYTSYITFLTATYPHLLPLQTFLSTPPDRINPLPLITLDIRAPQSTLKRTIPLSSTLAPLSTILTRPTPATVKSRTLIIPYLTPQLTNLLGSHFDLDPDFFLAHVPGAEAPPPLSSDPYQRLPLPPGGKSPGVSVYQCGPVGGTSHSTLLVLMSVKDAPGELDSVRRSVSRYHKPRYSEGPVMRERGVVDGLLAGGREVREVEGIVEGVVREWAGFLEGREEGGEWEVWERQLQEIVKVVEVGERRRKGEGRRRAVARDLEVLIERCAEGKRRQEELLAEEERVRVQLIREREMAKKATKGFWGLFGCARRRKPEPLSTPSLQPTSMRAAIAEERKPSVTSEHRNTKDSGIEMSVDTNAPWRASWSTIGKAT